MRLTKFSDYALRVLILAASKNEQHTTIEEAAHLYGVSAPHLKKVVRTLTREGFLTGKRGRSGGFKLAMRPEDIMLGNVVRATEPDFGLVECFLPDNRCGITCACKLPPILGRAVLAMLGVLDEYSLADISLSPANLANLPLPSGEEAQPTRRPRSLSAVQAGAKQ